MQPTLREVATCGGWIDQRALELPPHAVLYRVALQLLLSRSGMHSPPCESGLDMGLALPAEFSKRDCVVPS